MKLKRVFPSTCPNRMRGKLGGRRSRRDRKEAWFFCLFLFPSFGGIMLFVLLPFADVVKRSFFTAVTGEFAGMQNYRVIFSNQAFLLAVRNTLAFTLIAIPLLVLVSLLLALPLSGLKQAGWIKSIYLFPMAVPTAAVALIWKMAFYRQGFWNLLLTKLGEWSGLWGAVAVDYLNTDSSFAVLTVSYLWKNTGYTVVLWLAGICAVPSEMLEAAAVDGAGRWKRIWYMILPNLKGSLYTITVLSFLNSFRIYREAYLAAGAYPQERIYLLQHLFNNWFVHLEFDKMAAAAACTGGVLFIVILLLQRLWEA